MKKAAVLLSVLMLALFTLTACGGAGGEDTGAEAIYTAGTYEQVVQGYGGDMTVEVKVSETEIKEVLVTSHSETEGIGSIAVEELPFAIVEEQSTDVEGITGATMSSDAIKEAVAAALDEAKL